MKKVKILHTEGKGNFQEGDFELSDIKDTQIRVKSIFTGVCRSDIDMMNGNFGPLPLSMQGHEGLGKVLEVGSARGEGGFGDCAFSPGPASQRSHCARGQCGGGKCRGRGSDCARPRFAGGGRGD